MTNHQDEIAKLYASEIALCKRLLELEAEQTSIAGAAFDAVLEGADLANVPATAAVEILNVDRAIMGARDRRRKAIQEQRASEAAALRAQAAKLRTEADTRAEKTEALLAELEAHEGVTFMPVRPPQKLRPRAWHEMNPRHHKDKPAHWLRTKTQLQRREADQLEAQARSVEQQPIGESGSIACFAVTARSVLKYLEAWPADEFAPRYDDVARWLTTLPGTLEPRQVIEVHWNQASIASSSGVRLVEAAA